MSLSDKFKAEFAEGVAAYDSSVDVKTGLDKCPYPIVDKNDKAYGKRLSWAKGWLSVYTDQLIEQVMLRLRNDECL